MSVRGKPSEAHEYDESNYCKFCHTSRQAVEQMSLECKGEIELQFDMLKATENNQTLQEYRRG